MDFAKLTAPFPPDAIEWRVGSTNKDKTRGMALCYIDARAVMDRLDEVCGPAGWQCRYSHADNKTICEIGIKCRDEWVWKADGAGDTDFEAEKGALSSSLKRAAVRWGIGRYLYDLDAPWVAIDQQGRSYVIAHSEMPKLRALLTGRVAQRTEHGASDATVAGSNPAPATNDDPDRAKRLAWVEKAEAHIQTLRNQNAVDDFSVQHEEALARLKAADPELSLRLQNAIAERWQALSPAGVL